MSVVEKSAPRRRIVVIVVGVVVALVAAVAVVLSVDDGSSPLSTPSSAPASTVGPSSTASPRATVPMRVAPIDINIDREATYRVYLQRTATIGALRVFAYIDVARGELRYVDEQQSILGNIVGRFADMLVLEGSRLRFIDRDFAGVATFVDGDDFVGAWRDHAIVAQYFPERTSFHEYRVDGSEARSVALVGRRPDVVGGIVRNSVVVERAGRVLLVGLEDASVREFAVGKLLGVGGDRVFFTSCTPQGACTINEATLEGIVRTTPIGGYIDPATGCVVAQVAPDGSALVVFEPQRGSEVVIEGGARLPLALEGGPRAYTWAPSGRRLFYVDETADQLDIIDYRDGRVVTVPLHATTRFRCAPSRLGDQPWSWGRTA